MVTLGAILLLLQGPFGPSRQSETSTDGTSTIEGLVVRAGSDEPVPRASVTLVRTATAGAAATATDPNVSSTAMTVATGADGRFVMRNVAPGSYRIVAGRNGYARQEYGQRVWGGQGRVVTLVPGRTTTGIDFRLTPAGTVSGVVRDSQGEPLAGAQVQLLRPTYGSAGERTLQLVGGDRTDDRGAYRVYWLTPGRYYVAVNGAAAAGSIPLLAGTGSPNEVVERRYPRTYYPGTVDVAQAMVVDLEAGIELTAVDVAIADQNLFRVRGQILDPTTGRPPATASISIAQRGPAAAPIGSSGATATYDGATGTFEVRDVAPGSYWVRSTVSPSSPDSILPASAAGRPVADVFLDSLFADRRVAQVALDVFGDVEGLVLTLTPGVSIPGVLMVEGQPLSAVADVERLQVTLKPAAGALANPSRHEALDAQGRFTLENVLPGEYVVTVQSLPAEYYVKEVRFENADVLDRPLMVSGATGSLGIVLSPKAGQVDGVVVDARGRGVPGIQAVLVPARRPARFDLFRTAVTNQSGQFTIRGIPPGDYVAFAWEAIEAFGYFDEQLLRQSERDGTGVRIAESSKERVELRIIPAPRF